MDLSAFVPAMARHLGVKDPNLLEKDVRLHLLLARITADPRCASLRFKGGTLLIKSYHHYPRFSEDLDFTHVSEKPHPPGSKARRRGLSEAREAILAAVVDAAAALDMVPEKPVYNKNGGAVRMGLGYASHARLPGRIKVEVNLVEPLLYPPVKVQARSLLGQPTPELRLIDEELATSYSTPVECLAYDRREVVAEKGRAILTRQALKGRDVLDLFLLATDGVRVEHHLDQVRAKVRFAVDAFGVQARLLRDEKRLEADILDDVRSLLLREVDLEAVREYWIEVRPALVGVAREIADEVASGHQGAGMSRSRQPPTG